MVKIIVLLGRMGAGKSTVAAKATDFFRKEGYKALSPEGVTHFCKYGSAGDKHYQRVGGCNVTILPMAKPLKDVAISMGWDGRKDKKGRRLLQLLGTECGRNCIGVNVWTDKWKEAATKILTSDMAEGKDTVIIVDDCRFQNEYDMLSDLNQDVFFVKIHRKETWKERLTPKWMTHPSERGVKVVGGRNHFLIDNTGTFEQLDKRCYILFNKIKGE